MSRLSTASLRAKSSILLYWNTWRIVRPHFALRLHDWLHSLLLHEERKWMRCGGGWGAFTWMSARCSCTSLASSLSSSTAGRASGSVFGLWSAAILSVPAAAAAALTEPLLGHAKERCGGTRLRFVVITFACRLARWCGLRNRERGRNEKQGQNNVRDTYVLFVLLINW